MISLHGFPFQNLISLEMLQLPHNVLNHSSSLAGLEKLQILILAYEKSPVNLTGALASLSSLSELHVYSFLGCDAIDGLFIGLHNLKHVKIKVGGSCPEVVFCSVYEDYSVHSNANGKCKRVIPLTSLDFRTEDTNKNSLPTFKSLYNLTYLDLNNVNISEAIEALKWLDSPLQMLSIWSDFDVVHLNDSTFASWRDWKASLQVLSFAASEISLDGAPLEAFTNLEDLTLIGAIGNFKSTLSVNTFKGLRSLQNLQLANFNMNVLSSVSAFDIFSTYNSLILLDLSHNKLSGMFEALWDHLCQILSLEYIDVSFNQLDTSSSLYWSCSPPALKELRFGNQGPMFSTFSGKICEVAPKLELLDATAAEFKLEPYYDCPSLKSLILTEGTVFYNERGEMHLPQLQELYLNRLSRLLSFDITSVLTMFKAPKLQRLDLSENDITNINNELGKYLTNLTNLSYLDISYNKLVSVNNLHRLNNIVSLLIRGNVIKVVPKEMLRSRHVNMSVLDISGNPFQCDCNLKAFKNWILTDTIVQMETTFEYDYKCFSPDSKKGFSITQINLDCESHRLKYISTSVAFAIVILILAIMMVRYRWHIKYKLFLWLNRRRDQQYYLMNDNERIDDDEGGVPRYDAYVPYHIDDEDWVDGELLANIEEGEEPFRLCLRRRDIRAGRPIFSELSLHIQRSRKILVILSPRFVEDNWCYFELNMAHHRVLEENRNVMIIIILEEVPDNKMTLLLRQLFCRVQYLKWPADGRGQYLFWRCLREELKRPVPLDRRFNI